MANKAELIAEAEALKLELTGKETPAQLKKLIADAKAAAEAENKPDESEDSDEGDTDEEGDETDEEAAAEGAKPAHVVVSSTGTAPGKIAGKATDFVAVEHFHSHHRGPRQRIFSKDVHGKSFDKIALEFAESNPWPMTNSSGLLLPDGAGVAARRNHVRYVSANEAQAIEEENRSEIAAIDARREEQRRRGHRVTP